MPKKKALPSIVDAVQKPVSGPTEQGEDAPHSLNSNMRAEFLTLGLHGNPTYLQELVAHHTERARSIGGYLPGTTHQLRFLLNAALAGLSTLPEYQQESARKCMRDLAAIIDPMKEEDLLFVHIIPPAK
jgi:hypothetical protein